MTIRAATLSDVSDITGLVEAHAWRGQILHRSAKEIQDSINDWIVFSQDQAILACGSLAFYSPQLAEVRSLVVDDQVQMRGLGKAVLQALIEEAKLRCIHTLFAMTRMVPFFQSTGFTLSDKTVFPEKMDRDCDACPFQKNCSENAVVLQLTGASSLPKPLSS